MHKFAQTWACVETRARCRYSPTGHCHTGIGLAGSLPSPKEGKKLHRVSDRITMRERLSHYRSFFILHSVRMFTLKERITFRTVTDILIRRTLNFTAKLFCAWLMKKAHVVTFIRFEVLISSINEIRNVLSKSSKNFNSWFI